MAIRDKTQNKIKCSKLQKQPITKIAQQKTIQPNYYLSVASVDNSTTESTYIFLKYSTNTQTHVWKIQVKQNKFVISQNIK